MHPVVRHGEGNMMIVDLGKTPVTEKGEIRKDAQARVAAVYDRVHAFARSKDPHAIVAVWVDHYGKKEIDDVSIRFTTEKRLNDSQVSELTNKVFGRN